jgi:Zn-dependent membrane protease YugP
MSHAQFTVTVQPAYLPDHSDPQKKVYAFSYTITIQNTGEVAAQLIARHWIIEHADGDTEEVHGLGVVGHPMPGDQLGRDLAGVLDRDGVREGIHLLLRVGVVRQVGRLDRDGELGMAHAWIL